MYADKEVNKMAIFCDLPTHVAVSAKSTPFVLRFKNYRRM